MAFAIPEPHAVGGWLTSLRRQRDCRYGSDDYIAALTEPGSRQSISRNWVQYLGALSGKPDFDIRS